MPFVLQCTLLTEAERNIWNNLKEYYKSILWEEMGDSFVSFRGTLERSIFEKDLLTRLPYLNVIHSHHKPCKR